MIFLYIICILFLTLLVVSYIVFSTIFMPSKTLSLGKKKAIGDEQVIPDEIRNKYLAVYKEVAISGLNGNNLSGYFYSREDVSTWIVFLHGYRGRCTNMLKYMEYFRKAGAFNLLTVDLRGHGKRNEKYFSLGSTAETDDVMQWVNWIKTNTKNARIVLFGVSLGGVTAINTAGKNQSVFNGVITDSAPSSLKSMIKRIMHHKCGFLSSFIMPIVFLYARVFAKVKIEETSTIEQAAKINCPILLIHSKDDHFVPIKMEYEIFENLTVTDKEYLETSGAEHTHSVDVDPELYWATVDNFMQRLFCKTNTRGDK